MVIKLQSRFSWLYVLGFHAIVAGGWLLAMPGGFPMTHPRFWANRVAPAVLCMLVVAALIAALQKKRGVTRLVLVALGAMWIGVAIALPVIFPRSFLKPAPVALVIGGMALLASSSGGMRVPLRRALAVMVAVIAAACGAVLPLTQRAPQASTIPFSGPFDLDELPKVLQHGRTVRLSPSLSVHADDGSFMLQRGRIMLEVNPVLTFVSRSPDRCWTSLAASEARAGPMRLLVGERALGDDGIELGFHDDDVSRVAIRRGSEPGGAIVESVSRLPAPVFSHLNSFSRFSIAGGENLAIEFSPCPGKRIDIVYGDYPVGLPARSAYLDASGMFRIVQARNAEKGPFTELASGPLDRSQPLTMMLYTSGEPAAKIVLMDWSAQVSTALSPSAGWAHAVNAIEFSLDSSSTRSPATIFVTLAATSMGRGWDSVGHAAGVYHNRMTVELLSTTSPKDDVANK